MRNTDKPLVRGTRGLAFGSGLAVAGALLGSLVGATLERAEAEPKKGVVNYVVSGSHENISGVRLDEEFTLRFNAQVSRRSVGPDTIFLRTGANNSEQAQGTFELGKFMFDRRAQRRVVIRPEAVQEFFQLVRNQSRADAARRAEKFIRRVEQTGRFRRLNKIDNGLDRFFGGGFATGTRLDDDGDGEPASGVVGFFPPPVDQSVVEFAYRQLVAGDDALWEAHLNGDAGAYISLADNSEYERFFHRTDPVTGEPAEDSVLRGRQYRRVLINRKNQRRVMFVPQIPIRPDLSDSGFDAGRPYAVIVPTGQPGVFNTVLSKRGNRPLVQADGRDFTTFFNTVPTFANAFLDNEALKGISTYQKPRVINMTPPEGEFNVEESTDWENPDNLEQVLPEARRTFSIRLRFNQPLDPRTVDGSTFQLFKTVNNPQDPSGGTRLDPPLLVATGTFLNQQRLGRVEVEITPAQNLDPNSQYEMRVSSTVTGLNGQTQIGAPFRAAFTIGDGEPPVPFVKIGFEDTQDRAVPTASDTAGQITTCYWPAPDVYDPTPREGRATASFMPFTGFGQGAPLDPSSGLGDPIDRDPQLILQAGQSATFLTEDVDPTSATFGGQIEYSYQNIQATFASIDAIGRHPLVLRSQQSIDMSGTSIFLEGGEGGNGLTNSDVVNGGPTGGLGGSPGSGGFRGGDGGNAPARDSLGEVVVDGFGNFQFDANNLHGQDGAPSYGFLGPNSGGGGAGGFSADQQGDTLELNGMFFPESSPDRVRECGGGGGHAAAGSPGDGARVTQLTHPDGHEGGVGGLAFGVGDFSDQGLNRLGVPTLGVSAGGRGGGGGGREDDADGGANTDTVGAEDAGGGGGGGGGGAVQLVARDTILLDSTTIDVSGGAGGQTLDASGATPGGGFGAAGGCGSGGSIWLQCYGNVTIRNGSLLDASGGDPFSTSTARPSGSVSSNSPSPLADNTSPPPLGSENDTQTGRGGAGADGFVRIDAAPGGVSIVGSTVRGSQSAGDFRPVGLDSSYPSHPGAPMVENESVGFSRWFNSGLDTPRYVENQTNTIIGGTDNGGTVTIFARSAFDDPSNPGRPQLANPTDWVPLDSIEDISDRRHIQFRLDFFVPFTFTFEQELPYIDCIQVDVELR